MSLVDRTNETIKLSLEEGLDANEPGSVNIDVEFDSSFTPPNRVWFMFATDNEPWFRLTYEEAGLIHDRLGLILGRPQVIRAGEAARIIFPDQLLEVLGEHSKWSENTPETPTESSPT